MLVIVWCRSLWSVISYGIFGLLHVIVLDGSLMKPRFRMQSVLVSVSMMLRWRLKRLVRSKLNGWSKIYIGCCSHKIWSQIIKWTGEELRWDWTKGQGNYLQWMSYIRRVMLTEFLFLEKKKGWIRSPGLMGYENW